MDTHPAHRSETRMSGLPREVIKWLQSLDLSSPLRNVRRDFSNGYLVAEIMSCYHDKEMQMHSYSNGSSLQVKLGNWKLLEKFFTKAKLIIPQEFIEGTIHCKPGAAIALLERIYVLLTNRVLHYLPAKGRANDFSDKEYQSHLPLYARSTVTQSIKTNIASTELTAEPDRTVATQKTQAIIEHYNEQMKHQKEEFPERYKGGRKMSTKQSTIIPNKSVASSEEIPEIVLKQKTPSTKN